MAYFDKIKNFYITSGVSSNPIAKDIALNILFKIIQTNYLKDYLQIIELEKLKENTLKINIRQEEVNEEIKENKIEFTVKCYNEKLFKEFKLKKLYLIENEKYNGITAQTLLLPEDY